MHGAAFFRFREGRGREKNFDAGQGVKSLGQGGVTVKLEAFSGWGGAVLKFFLAGPGRGSHFSPEVRFVTAVTAGGSVKFCQWCKFLHFHSGCQIFGLKIWRCKFFDKSHV